MNTHIVMAVFSIMIGILYCCAGYRWFKVALAITGFVTGFALARLAAVHFFDTTGILVWIVGFFGGLCLAAVSLLIYFLGVFVFGAAIGTLAGFMISITMNETAAVIIMIMVGIICGGLALLLQRHIIIAWTAFGGSWSIVTGIWYIARGIPGTELFRGPSTVGREYYLALACLVVLTVLGMTVQYRINGTRHGPPASKSPKSDKE